jgi:hypothetical protein
MAKISLLHPSRGRPVKSFMNTSEWLNKASGKHDIEIICAVDIDDPTRREYGNHYKQDCYEFPSKDVVQATNFAAKVATGDILVYLSDDFSAPDNWDELIVREFENENRPLVLKVDDCLQPFHTQILTIPIMNRALYEKLGYFWHPGYKSMFVDCDLYWTALSIGAVKMCPHLKFPHHHYSNGKAQHDETYKRSEANWNQGKEVFAQRKAQKFPI